MKEACDVLIVGAGFSGLVMAERISTCLGKKVIVIDKRSHIGGNAHDRYDQNGVLYHAYGPHYFRTNSDLVRDYLGRFTAWTKVEYKILSSINGRYWKFPINLNTFEQLLGRESTTEEMERYLAEKRVAITEPKNSEEVIVSQVGWELYEMFFKGYTMKQWRLHPRELDASVCGRIPIRVNRDDRYLRESFQALPADGYTEMFKRMAASAKTCDLRLGTGFEKAKRKIAWRHLIYTGPIDEYYNYRYGHLPYRSLRFELERFEGWQLEARREIAGKAGFWQPALQINYPNEEDFTRIVEMKHAIQQRIAATTIVKEYPDDYAPGKEAYYPIPNAEAQAQYAKYKALSQVEPNVTFAGRLACYKYLNMDQVVALALAEFDKLAKKL